MRCNIVLDFDLLDDICLACQSATVTYNDLPRVGVSALGPLLELIHIAPRIDGFEIGHGWLKTHGFDHLLAHLHPIKSWAERDFSQGIVSIGELTDDGPAWVNFVHNFRKAAKDAGFSSDHSAKLGAAIGEIYGNVIDHSNAVHSGYIAYRATRGRFEFVVADHGIGVLRSLRTNPRYSNLTDSGVALEMALEKGISRYTDGDHGFGFVRLFIGLANVSRLIRFRSGRHARMIERQTSGGIESHTVELALSEGFFCSVLCDLE